jgi:hypothetical protein
MTTEVIIKIIIISIALIAAVAFLAWYTRWQEQDFINTVTEWVDEMSDEELAALTQEMIDR